MYDYCAFVMPIVFVLAPRGPLYRPFVGLYVSELYAFWISFFWRIWQLCACSRMSAVLEGTSSNNKEDESVLLAEIEELKKKRPRALTEEQKTDILVAYRSLQVEDLKRKKMRPGQKCGKGNYQRRVSSVLGYSSKTVGLTYRDWNRKQEIKVAVAAANRKPSANVYLNRNRYCYQ